MPVLPETVEPPVPSTLRVVLVAYGVLLAWATGIFSVATPYEAFSTSFERVGWALFVLALYMALAVVSTDLMHDVWPGATSMATLQRAFTYYVYIFEQWRNWAIPGALLADVVALDIQILGA